MMLPLGFISCTFCNRLYNLVMMKVGVPLMFLVGVFFQTFAEGKEDAQRVQL